MRLADGTIVLAFGHKDAGEGQKFTLSYDFGVSFSNTVYDLHRGGLYASSVALSHDHAANATIVTAFACTGDAQSLCSERTGLLTTLHWTPPPKAEVARGGFFYPVPPDGYDTAAELNVTSHLGHLSAPVPVTGSEASINLTSVMLSPVYRGRIVKGGCKAIKLRAHIDFRQHYDILELELVATLSHRVGSAVVETTSGGALQSVVDLAFKLSPESLDAGEYTVSCSLRNASSGSVLHQMSHNVTRVADSAPQPTAWIDEHHRLIYKGKPKFVLGLYMSWIPDDPGDPGWSTRADDIDMIGNSSFNTIMPYWVLVENDFNDGRSAVHF